MDLFGEFEGVYLTDEQQERIETAREGLWYTLALLTSTVPAECSEKELQNMHKGLKACLMYRNHVRAAVMEATDQPIPSPEELEAYRDKLTESKETIH